MRKTISLFIPKLSFFCTVLFILLFLTLSSPVHADLQLHFLDVGQGDAMLVQCDEHALLIDAGDDEHGPLVAQYLQKTLGLSALDAVIATHVHDDHVGGMAQAIRKLQVGRFYLSKSIPTSWWLANLLPSSANGRMVVYTPKQGDSFMLGGARVTFLNRDEPSWAENNRSLVLRIDYGSTAFLLPADAETEAELQMMADGVNLTANVLKVGHHGGEESTFDSFLAAVQPEIAVISVGKDNEHGHPDEETLNCLQRHHVDVYRTDRNGTITCISDGNKITVRVERVTTGP